MKIFQRVLNIGIISSDLTGSVCLMENLKENNVELEYKIPLLELSDSHIKTSAVDVWLVDLDDDDWSDQLDELLDHAATPVFINEQSAISRQKHPQFWVQKLIVRLGELVLEVPSAIEQTKTVPSNNQQSKAREKSTKPLSASTAIEGLENPGQDSQPAEKVIPIWVLGASLGGPAALKRFLQKIGRAHV